MSDDGHRDEVAQLQADYPVSYAIFAVARVHRAIAATELAKLGLFPNQEIVIVQLGARDGVPQKVLAATLQVSHATVAKMLARMERAGLVRRAPSTVDRRMTLAYLTDAGRALRERILGVWAHLEASATADLPPDLQQAFLAATERIRPALDAAASPGDVQPA